jgi:hydroxymethylpyrimidine pyrophosphatase-like HAD family hydrolase/fructoselysine-6-P-deglycase FrlB-like protein
MTGVFSSKVDTLTETVDLACRTDHGFMAEALEAASDYPVAAIGSGGSMVAAEFLSSCRSWLQHAPTAVCTPMAFVLDPVLPQWGVWLFSASGENPDVRAAFQAAVTEHADRVDFVTSRREGAVAVAGIALRRPRVHVVPVAQRKDGFLATHSLVSTVTSLLLASDGTAGFQSDERTAKVAAAAREILGKERSDVHRSLAPTGAAGRDTLLILHDPSLTAAAVMIETSCWEAGLGAVQRTDFRNFAHGRHVWLANNADRTFILALTHDRTRKFWTALEADIPAGIARAHFDFGPAGRFGLFTAILRSFAIVEGLGLARQIDPGKLSVADFGRRLFAQEHLLEAVESENAATRRKRRAEAKADRENRGQIPWPVKHEDFVRRFAQAEIGAIVLDYDGTVVPTDRRLDPPDPQILSAMQEWISKGLVVAFATGRGGSVGEMLREHLPEGIWSRIPVGYYNGAHIITLDVDLARNPANPDPVVERIFSEVSKVRDLFQDSWLPKQSPFQITIPFDKLAFRAEGTRKLREIVALHREARIFRSGHSLDICPAWGGKRRVIEHVRRQLTHEQSAILSVGDSGDRHGNDYELLEGNFGLSVDSVCDRDDSCWNLLPPEVSGPKGLLTILRALRETGSGRARLDVSALAGTV